ncbi:MAG: DoxX family protein [Pyrinomonadaceae bacterium]
MSETGNSKIKLIISWVLSIAPCLLFFMSAFFKFAQPEGFAEGLKHMGWEPSTMKALGVVEILSTLIYLFPKTSILGAILLTGYMGGAIATHVRVGDPFLMQIGIGVVLWLALWLREERLGKLIPLVAGK